MRSRDVYSARLFTVLVSKCSGTENKNSRRGSCFFLTRHFKFGLFVSEYLRLFFILLLVNRNTRGLFK